MNVQPATLTDEAAAALARGEPPAALYDEIREGVVQLWRVDEGRAWIATEAEGDALWVHLFAGRQCQDAIRWIFLCAERQGFRQVLARTRKQGIVRMLRRHGAYCCGWANGQALVAKITTRGPHEFQ